VVTECSEVLSPKACLRAAAGCEARSKTDGKLGRRRSATDPKASCLTCRGSSALFDSLRGVGREVEVDRGGAAFPRLGNVDDDDDDASPLTGVGPRRSGIELTLLSTIACDSLAVLSLRSARSTEGKACVCSAGDAEERSDP
jgi:hypothetical protein